MQHFLLLCRQSANYNLQTSSKATTDFQRYGPALHKPQTNGIGLKAVQRGEIGVIFRCPAVQAYPRHEDNNTLCLHLHFLIPTGVAILQPHRLYPLLTTGETILPKLAGMLPEQLALSNVIVIMAIEVQINGHTDTKLHSL